MIDIEISFIIKGVPTKNIADQIAGDVSQVLAEKHSTDILITWEDITPEDTGDHT